MLKIISIQLDNKIMSNSEAATQQIKEYKDFTTITNIRKLTQEAINPVITSIQAQLSEILSQNQQLRKEVAKMDDIFSSQAAINSRIEQTNKNLRAFKQEQAQHRRVHEKEQSRLSTANETLFLETHQISTKVNAQNQSLLQMTNKNTKCHEMYTNLEARIENSISGMQDKYSNFTKQILELENSTQIEYKKYVSEMQAIRIEFKRERDSIEEKTKAISLYFQERQMYNSKFEDLYTKILHFVSKEDFEGYRKSQAKTIQARFDSIQATIDEVLPDSLRKILPSVEAKLREVQRIPSMAKHISKLQDQKDSLEQRVVRNNADNSNLAVKIETNLTNMIGKAREELAGKIQKISEDIQIFQEKQAEKLIEVRLELQQEMLETIERETSIIHKTIDEQVKMKQESIHSARDSQINQQFAEVRDIRDKILGRYAKIEEIGEAIDGKIEAYSSRITRIRSDYEIFADAMRKEVSGATKFKHSFGQKLEEVGSVLAGFGEMLLMNGALAVHSSLLSAADNMADPLHKDGLAYVMENDGIIYEYQPNASGKRSFLYRRQKLEPRQFMRSYMYSMTTFMDDMFTAHEFLNWNQHKPSAFFTDRVLDNYSLQTRRLTDSRAQSHHTNYQSAQNMVIGWNSDIDIAGGKTDGGNSNANGDSNVNGDSNGNIDGSGNGNTNGNENGNINANKNNNSNGNERGGISSRQFTRTIETGVKRDKTVGEGNSTQGEIKRNYSIKKAKAVVQKNRYDGFLTSRSGCRSRISQMI